jgi:hypothetical protein
MKPANKFLQYRLLEQALIEENILNATIEIDHKTGVNIVNGVRLGIVFPKSYVVKCSQLDNKKKYKYVFKGGLTSKKSLISRRALLDSYISRTDSVIAETYVGIKSKQLFFDTEYYQLLSNGKFSLCPNWAGEWWNHSDGWTYRFIESCFTKSIPILFKDAPVGLNFIQDIFYFWNTDSHTITDIDYQSVVSLNFEKALDYWTLTDKKILDIKG